MNRIRAIAAAFAALALLFISCADMFQEKIPKRGGNLGSLDDIFRSTETITKLAIPTQLYAVPYYSQSQIRLSWEEVRYAAYYQIERAIMKEEGEEPDDGDFSILDRFVYGRTYTDEVLKNPALDSPEYEWRFYYRVSAFNPADRLEESEPCKPVYAKLFRAPSNVRASGGTSTEHVTIYWERTEGAASYEIWRSDSEQVKGSLLATVQGNLTSYINRIPAADQGKDFFYRITARKNSNGTGNESLSTDPALGYAKINGAPDAPIVKRSDNYGRGNSANARIEWNSDTDAHHYAVYRFSSADSSLIRLTQNTTDLFYVDTGLKTGVYYYYRVQAIGIDSKDGLDKEMKSEFSGPDMGSKKLEELTAAQLDALAESFLLSPPDRIIVEKEGGEIVVRWLPPIGSAAERAAYTYTVFGSSTLGGTYTTSVTSSTVPAADGYVQAEFSSPLPFFRIVTHNGSTTSPQSIEVAPSPDPAIITEATQRAFISADTRANRNGVYPVVVRWKKPASSDNPAFYQVMRSTRQDGGFSKLNVAPLKADGTGDTAFSLAADGVYSFIDIDANDTVRPGRKYYYRVLSLNQLESGSFYSDTLVGWGALTHDQYMLEYNKTMKAALKKLTYMHKPGSTEKLGTETKTGTLGGTIYYNAALSGLGARIIIRLTNYSEFYIDGQAANGIYFTLNGESNTSANMSSNGDMDGTVTCTGMYPGTVRYDKISIKGGAAGGGTYGIQPAGFPLVEVNWTLGEQ